MEKTRRNALLNALALAVIASCGEMSAGRCVSAFYGQTGKWSWMGIGIAGVLFGLLMGGILRLKRRTGANTLAEVYTGIFGRKAGAVVTALHVAFSAFAACALLGKAAETAELALPFHRAAYIGAISAAIFSLLVWRQGASGIRKLGCLCFAALAAVMFALLVSGKLPSQNTMHFYVELELENKPWAAVLLALIHASMAAGMCAAAAVRLYPAHIKPGLAGFVSAIAFAMLMASGNGVFSVFPREINALRYPFTALSASWGAAGFYIFALMRYLECVACLAGIFCMLPAVRK